MEDAVFSYVERFAAVLVAAGMPPMPSRVFIVLLVSDDGLTAAELAQELRISAAAVSGAVRYLMPLGLVHRERVPGSRRDRYRVPDDVWSTMMRMRDQVMGRWAAMLREGEELMGADSAAGRRLRTHTEFFTFIMGELENMLERWEKYRATRTP